MDHLIPTRSNNRHGSNNKRMTMFRKSSLGKIKMSAVASMLLIKNLGQPTNAFVYPTPMPMTSAFGNCFRGSSMTSGSRDVVERMPLHSVVEENMEDTDLPEMQELKPDTNGIYDLSTKEDHVALLEANPGKIIVMKFYAPWCRACKGLEPKFIQISKDEKYEKLPILFSQMSVQHNKAYIKSLGVVALPSIHIYSGRNGLVENFPCGPSKVPVLKKKIAQVVNNKVDPKTLDLKPVQDSVAETEPCAEREVSGTTGNETRRSVGDVQVSEETMGKLRAAPYFKDLSNDEFNDLMAKSTYSTFEAGSVIMRQGYEGRTFYWIDSGEVELYVRGPFEDPLTTPSDYLGSAINRLGKGDYFGERSLITSQPRAASIRTTEKTRCFIFDVKDIPTSSVLSGKRIATSARLAEVDDKYGVDYYDIDMLKPQLDAANMANQARGSFNTPERIEGVDTDDGIIQFNDNIVSLLVRFKLLRNAARCFEYIKLTNPRWGDVGETNRRALLVSKLTSAQKQEFTEVFRLIDTSHDNRISVMELKSALEVLDGALDEDERSEEEVEEIINKADPSVDGNKEISYGDFMGVMAEAEFYYLFKDTFSTLDKKNSGYVQAGKLEKVLCGLRDLISDDRKSIIDMEDKDMLVDYETFSMMMIGRH